MNLISTLIKLVWGKVSPELRENIVKFVNDLDVKAKATDNPFDDFAVQVLKLILGITT